MKYDPTAPFWKSFRPSGKHMLLEEARGPDGGPKLPGCGHHRESPTQEYIVVECSVSFNGDVSTPLGEFMIGGTITQDAAEALEAMGVCVTVRLSRSQRRELALETAQTLCGAEGPAH